MRGIYYIAIILLMSSRLNAEEPFVSKEFSFAATFPSEVHSTTGKHKYGLAGTFQAVDGEDELIWIVSTNIVPAFGFAFASGKVTAKELIASNFEGVAKGNGAIPESVNHSWGKWNDHDCLDFIYTSSQFAPNGALAFHQGKAIFIMDTFYFLQVVSLKEGSPLDKGIQKLSESFVLIKDLNKTTK